MNEFASTYISLPVSFRDHFGKYSLTRAEGSHNDPEDSPFPRMVDMWFMAICIAVKKGLKPKFDVKGKTYKMIDGSILGSDNWRSDALMLLAISHEGKVEVTGNPNKMMKIANAYALAGIPHLIKILEERKGDTAIDHLSEAIEDMIS